MTWFKSCLITDERTEDANRNANPPVPKIRVPENATFEIKYTKFCAPVVTLLAEDDNKLLEQLKTGCKRTIKCNKCRSEMNNQARTNNLYYLIDPTFSKVNILFVLSFKINEDENKDDIEHAFKVLCTRSRNKIFQCIS